MWRNGRGRGSGGGGEGEGRVGGGGGQREVKEEVKVEVDVEGVKREGEEASALEFEGEDAAAPTGMHFLPSLSFPSTPPLF